MNRLTLDIIADYIKTNLTTFTNEEVIVLKQEKNIINKNIINKNIISKNNIEEKKDFKSLINNLNKNRSISIDTNFFHNVPFVEFLKDFLILKTHSDDNKNSFYTCILSALDDKFIFNSSSSELSLVNNLIQYLKTDIMQDGFRINGYSKLKWTKNKILEDLNKNIISEKIIRYVSDALHINIFLIDNTDDNKIKYAGGDFVPFKKNILLLKMKDYYYLICTSNEKYFIFKKNEFIKSLLITPECINLLLCESFVCVGRNYINNSSTLELQNNIKNKKDDDNDNTDDNHNHDETSINGFEEESVTNKKYNDDVNDDINDEYINENLSLIELQKKAKEFNIDCFTSVNGVRKLKNKKELCKDILKNIKHK